MGYISKLREGINDSIKNYGNKAYYGLGDILTTEINNSITTFGLVGLLSAGCAAGIKYTNPNCPREEIKLEKYGKITKFFDGKLCKSIEREGEFKNFEYGQVIWGPVSDGEKRDDLVEIHYKINCKDGKQITESTTMWAIDKEKCNLIKDYGSLKLKICSTDDKIKTCENRGDLYSAAQLAEQDGMVDKAKEFYTRASEKYEKEGEFYDAAKSAEKAGLVERAKELYAKSIKVEEEKGQTYRAADAAEKAGMIKESRKLQIKNIKSLEQDQIFDSVQVAKEAGMLEIARELAIKGVKEYLKGNRPSGYMFGNLFLVADIVKEAGMPELANEFYSRLIKEREKYFTKEAAYIAERAGMKERAKELYIKAIDTYEKKGEFWEAITIAKEIGLEDRVKELLKKAEEREKNACRPFYRAENICMNPSEILEPCRCEVPIRIGGN